MSNKVLKQKNKGGGDNVGRDKITKIYGLDEKQTAGVVGEQLDEKLKPISQTVFDTANTVEASAKCITNIEAIAEEILMKENAGYSEHLKAGWDYLCYGDFVSAIYEFRDALRCDKSGHEAHFGMALAVHRIQLLDIGKESTKDNCFNKIPIYCEVEKDLYLDGAFEKDQHYKNALKYSKEEPEIQNKYTDCAKKIKDIIRAFNQYRRENKEYDCFICSKVTELDENGKPIVGVETDDCLWAKKLHEKLKRNGLNPFFSENDIKGQADVAGTEYEALILYALIHSKCMVIVCSNQNYFDNSRFMQNEYRRFIGFLRRNGKELDNIYLVRKNNIVNLPNVEKREAFIRTENDDDFQKVYEYVNLKVRGKVVNASAKKYCVNCNESYELDSDYCKKCGNPLVSFEQYEKLKFDKLQEHIAIKQRELDKEIERVQKEKEKNHDVLEELNRRQREINEERKQLQNERAAINEVASTQYSTKKEDINLIPLEDVEMPGVCSEKVLKLFKAAKRGNKKAQFELGQCYYCGHGVTKDNIQAVGWYSRAAASGYVNAQNKLGDCFYYGLGVKRDLTQAVKWYKYAAEKKFCPAQVTLGSLYERGLGVEQDYSKSIVWYKKAAKHGDEGSCKSLARFYRDGLGVDVDEDAATKWRRRPAQLKKVKIGGGIIFGVLALCTLIFYLIWCFSGFKTIFPSSSGYIWMAGIFTAIICCLMLIPVNIFSIHVSGWKKSRIKLMALAVIIIYILIFTLFPLLYRTIFFYDFEQDGIYYNIQEDGTLSVCESERGIKSANIPNEINGYRVSSINENAFFQCKNLTDITIPESVTSIGDRAFMQCSKLITLTLPKSLTSIGSYAFYACSALPSITIPKDIASIKERAFDKCDSLETVYWNAVACTEIGNDESFSIFGYGNSITNVIFGEQVSIIPENVFAFSDNLISITISDSVTDIGHSAFQFCASLKSVTIPEGITSIGYNAFGNCKSLETVYWNAIACEKTGGFLPIFGIVDNNITQILLGECVSIIPEYAFFGCGKISNIVIPDSVSVIKDNAFNSCHGLTNIMLPDGLTSIGSRAFLGCSGLTNVTIPNSLTNFGSNVFYGCDNLEFNQFGDALYLGNDSNKYVILIKAENKSIKNYSINEKVKFIYDNAFEDCNLLTSIIIPQGVIDIGYNAFSGCTDLKDVYYTGNIVSWCGIYGLDNLMSSNNCKLYIDGKELVGDLIIPVDVTSIGSAAFYGCSGLTSITIPENVMNIGDYAFTNCFSLESITVSKNNSKFCDIEGVLFDKEKSTLICYPRCKNDKTYIIPNSVKNIGDMAFMTTSNTLKSITIPRSVTNIGALAFALRDLSEGINYAGSINEWNAIEKGDGWNYFCSISAIYCSDGNIESWLIK